VLDDADPIQLSTDVVNVLFSVTDQKNRFIGDLKEGDVVISEEGTQQEIFSFSRETNLPIEIALLIDTSSSQEFTFDDEKRAATAFFQNVLGARKDRAAIVSFNENVQYIQGLTGRLARVSDAFNRLVWRSSIQTSSMQGATALYDAVGITSKEIFPPMVTSESDAFVRRAIILITDGEDTASSQTLQDAIDAALQSNVIVYAIGIGDRYRSAGVKQNVLNLLAEQTGGHAYYPTSYENLRSAFHQIDEELRSQYLIAYEPSNYTKDGQFRAIEITIPGRGDVKIFHRKGYYAPRSGGPGPTPGVRRPR
jgi:VWFA-related protein